jgi:hypothetical protein
MNDLFDDKTFKDDQDLRIADLQRQVTELRDRYEAPDAKPWSHYQKIKKENPDTYWRSDVQKQMHKDATTLGDRFIDGDYEDNKFRESNINLKFKG